MIEKSDSKWISLAAASILGQAPRDEPEALFVGYWCVVLSSIFDAD
ncbi:MAG: hypothetical protein V3V31_12155 [Methylococcales bacterium]